MKRAGYFIWILVLLLAFLLDKHIVNFIFNMRMELLNPIFTWIADYISQVVIVVLAIMLLLFKKDRIKNILTVIMSSVSAGVITHFLKRWIARPRPEVLMLIDKTNYAFPSGHMAVLFACVPVIEKEFPRYTKYVWLFILVVGFARLYSGIHYLSDLIGGALFGYLIGVIFLRLRERL